MPRRSAGGGLDDRRAGGRCQRLELERAWLVDPWTGREGVGSLLVEDGRIADLRWAGGRGAPGTRPGLLVPPGPTRPPPVAGPGVRRQVLAAAAASGSPVRVDVYGTTSAGRGGLGLSAMGELADAGAAGFSDDGSPVADAALFRNAPAYARRAGWGRRGACAGPAADRRCGDARGTRGHDPRPARLAEGGRGGSRGAGPGAPRRGLPPRPRRGAAG